MSDGTNNHEGVDRRQLLAAMMTGSSLFLAGCSSGDDDGGDSGGGDSGGGDSGGGDSGGSDSGDSDGGGSDSGGEMASEVTFTSTDSFANDLQGALGTALEESNEFSLNVQPTPDESAGTRDYLVQQFLNESAAFDVGMFDVVWPAEFVSKEWLTPIDDPEGHTDKMLSTPVDAATIDGTLYGLPIFTDANMLYYRTDLLEQAGYDSPPETFTELINMAQTVKSEVDDSLEGYIWQGGANEGLTIMWLNWLWGMDGSVRQDGKLVVNTQKGIDALQHAVDLIYEHEITPERMPETGTDGNRQTFQEGNTIFMRNWPYAYSIFQDDTPVTDKFAVTSMPSHEDTQDANNSCLGGWSAFVNQFSQNPKAAQATASWMGTLKAQEIMAAEFSRLPVREELYNDDYWSDSDFEKPDPLDIFEQVLQETKPRPATAQYTTFSEIVYTECNAALKQNKSPEKALNSAQEQIDSQIN